MNSLRNARLKRDKYGVALICRVCRKLNFPYNHHPNQCRACYKCGQKDHIQKECHLNLDSTSRAINNVEDISPRRVSIIDNTKYLEQWQPVSLDLEKVRGRNKQLPGWVVICITPTTRYQTQNRVQVIYSAKIRQLRPDVTNFQTRYSGLSAINLSEQAIRFSEVKEKLKIILKNRTVIGVNMNDDLKCLELDKIVKAENRFEFNEVFYDAKRQSISLKALAFVFLGIKIQEYCAQETNTEGHDPVIDARVTMQIYELYSKNSEKTKERKQKFESFPSHQWVRDEIRLAISKGELPRLTKPKRKVNNSQIDWGLVKDNEGNFFRIK